MEIESAWLQQAQAQASQQLAAMGSAGNAQAAPVLPAGDGADEAAAAWTQWIQRWQSGVDDMSRAWNDALHAAQPRH
jgi:hypothetical protein